MDQGGEYTSGAFRRYYTENGIQQQFTVTDTHQQNGVAKRRNRTLVECARSMLQGKKKSNGFWDEAINTDVYLKNRSPTKKLELQTPFEVFHGYKPEISHLRIFGSRDFAYIPVAAATISQISKKIWTLLYFGLAHSFLGFILLLLDYGI